ncbi:hypothetical protein COK29_30895, partial [Bacillus cereus]|uniref:YopX family protein n=1 Tax=Bacillus cereus TaxID=1396 RepID=UPI000C013E44
MREIKIRIWDKLNKKMWQPENIAIIDFQSKCVWINDEYRGGHWVYFNTAEMLQYTGLLDKNGKEIYEGDIISYHARVFESSGSVVVCFADGGFGTSDWWLSDIGECEVIGNI